MSNTVTEPDNSFGRQLDALVENDPGPIRKPSEEFKRGYEAFARAIAITLEEGIQNAAELSEWDVREARARLLAQMAIVSAMELAHIEERTRLFNDWSEKAKALVKQAKELIATHAQDSK